MGFFSLPLLHGLIKFVKGDLCFSFQGLNKSLNCIKFGLRGGVGAVIHP